MSDIEIVRVRVRIGALTRALHRTGSPTTARKIEAARQRLTELEERRNQR